MPAKNRVKKFLAGGYYHIYNRGVEKRRIFLDDQDYRVFLHLLEYYLSPFVELSEHPLKQLTGFIPVRKRPLNNLAGEIELISYCLMPNHFHLLIKQVSERGMQKLMQKLLTTYAIYFNRRYDRVGHLFQGPYKAALVENDAYLLHLSRYIHQNPSLTKGFLAEYPYSSYQYYLGNKKSGWLKTDLILSFFKEPEKNPLGIRFTTYKDFVELYEKDPKEILGGLVIEKD